MLGELERLVDQRLVEHDLAHAAAAVGGDHQRGPRVVDARREARRGEAAEHHRVDRADARAGEDRERGLGDHRHVDDDPVALLHAERLHHRGDAVHFLEQLLVGEAPGLRRPRWRSRPARSARRARARWRSTRVVAEVGLAADEPFRERRPGIVEHLARTACASARASLLRPRSLRDRRANGGGNRGKSSPLAILVISPVWPGSPWRSSSAAGRTRPPRDRSGAISVPSRKRSTRSSSPGMPAGAGSAGGGGAAAATAARCSLCSARRIRSSIEVAGSAVADATPRLLTNFSGRSRYLTFASSSSRAQALPDRQHLRRRGARGDHHEGRVRHARHRILGAHLLQDELRDAGQHHVGDVLARGERDVVVGFQAQRHHRQLAAVAARVREMLAAFRHEVVRRVRAGERVVGRGGAPPPCA